MATRAADPTYGQDGAGVRFDWGVAGAAALSKGCRALVVVDVLSFTTAVDIAVSRGIRVHPFPWGAQAHEYGRRVGAAVAVGRGAGDAEHPWTLSPAALATAPFVENLVLPSPNGSAICATASATGLPVLAACARNAGAVARWLRSHGFGAMDAPVGVVAAGEQWPDGRLRPCVADLLGAALVLDGLVDSPGGLSVEAAMTVATLAARPDVSAAIRGCVSGRELAQLGYPLDVEAAAAVGVSEVAPLLRDGAFHPAVR
ncbi:2-phosphosulfolactate phosphatase [Pilimelia columellifera]|uniref:Probable 2-phosphosulfolactate phosphatase n=1 Tax=Pilimelia columellifera subsp. columellifera TaxID=706583 RepID=A0ABN3N261_9ACTN